MADLRFRTGFISPAPPLTLPVSRRSASRINADAVAALGHPIVKDRLEQFGATLVGSTPQELAAFLKAEMDKWGPVIREAKIKVDE